MTTDEDPGSTGKKFSKSGDDGLEERNKSYNKVLDAMIAYVAAKQKGLDTAAELLVRWNKKSEWHLNTYGW